MHVTEENLRLSAQALDLQTRTPFGISRWTRSTMRNVLVRVWADGVEGIGEGAPNPRYGETQEATIAQLGDCHLQIPKSLDALKESLRGLASTIRGGAALSALEMAIWDYYGRRERLPLHSLLGFAYERGPVTAYTIAIDGPSVMEEQAKQNATRPVLKVKVGTDDDLQMVALVRRASGAALWVDANEGWASRDEAISRIESLARLGVVLVEQPLPAGRLQDMEWLKERSPVPLFADEDCSWNGPGMQDLACGFDGVNLKLDKCGGLLRGLSMLEAAKAAGLEVMVGCNVASSVAITAAATLALGAERADLDGNLLLAHDPYQGVCLDASHRLVLPKGYGLGVRPVAP